jgi:hypothetical protein
MIPERYNRENLVRVIREPSLAVKEMQRQVRPLLHIPRKIWFKQKHGSGIDIMSEDWDFLIILDACRYDAFEEVIDIDGELKSVISRGSHSIEFCKKNFEDKQYHDTVYVTANGYGAQIAEGVFHDLIFTDEDDLVPEVDVLHSSHEGMAPSTVYDAALDAVNKYPNKRIIIHFMQPHDPYLGEKAEVLRSRVESDGLTVISRDPKKIKKHNVSECNTVSTLAGAVEKGYVTENELQTIYYENLEVVSEYVSDLVESLTGEIVVTADHGEMLGERNIIGHPKYKYFNELREVPWLRVSSNTRREVYEEEPVESVAVDDNVIEKRLKALGYKDGTS